MLQEYMAMRRESQRNGWNGTIKADEDMSLPNSWKLLKLGSIPTGWICPEKWLATNHQIGVRGGTAKTPAQLRRSVDVGYHRNMDSKVSGRLNLDQKSAKSLDGVSLPFPTRSELGFQCDHG